jgi:hypothetical protein
VKNSGEAPECQIYLLQVVVAVVQGELENVS